MLDWHRIKKGIVWLGLLLPLTIYGAATFRRPQPTELGATSLFKGITYRRQVQAQPRPLMVHVLEIDLTAPGLKPYVSPGYEGADLSKYGIDRREVLAQETSAFLATHQLQLAVNANFFYPFREVTPWNYAPTPGQTANLVGIAISDGEVVSNLNPNGPIIPTVCFMQQQAEIRDDGACSGETLQAVAGNLLLLSNGQPTEAVLQQIPHEQGKPYPFTVVALDQTGTRLWLVLTDGKQPFYSEGATLEEITQLVQDLGADRALRLDGGGSTTAAIATPNGPQVLNVPIHAKIPGKERPVANHLGFFAQPVAP